jgi:peptidoglycan/xylan/chitin deacetylase (PgdA/CDA1 family)
LFGPFVLAFHNLPAARFEAHIEALRPNEPVPLSTLVDRIKQGKPTRGTFAITVDDGVGETVRALGAVAVEREWPVTFYLPTRYLDTGEGIPFQWLELIAPRLPSASTRVGSMEIDASTPAARRQFEESVKRIMKTRPAIEYVPFIQALIERARAEGWIAPHELQAPAPIAWHEVATLARHEVIQFESHGVSHTAVSVLPVDDLEQELKDSRDRIVEHSNRPCRHFCYPFGGPESIGHRAAAVVERFYDSAVTLTRGRLNGRNPYLLPRIPVYERDTASVARLKTLTC